MNIRRNKRPEEHPSNKMIIFQARRPTESEPRHKPITIMNQTDQAIYNRIAEEFPLKTALMQRLFRMNQDEIDEAEDRVRTTLEREATERFSANPQTAWQAARAAWLVLAAWLEHGAISRFKAKHPEIYAAIPELLTAEEAAECADMELQLTPQEKQMTVQLLRAVAQGNIELNK